MSGGRIAAELTPIANSAYATGSPVWPILDFTLQMNFNGPSTPKSALDFKELRCRISPFDGSYIAASLPSPIQLTLGSGRNVSNHKVHLEVPVDRKRIASIDRARKGGDVNVRLDLELIADELIEISRIEGVPPQPIWGFKECHRMRAQTHIQIARSQWVEQILPATGIGKVYIIELPAIPLENCAEMHAAFEALQHAYKLEGQGLYAEAVSKCRFALEPFFEYVEKDDGQGGKKRIPKLKISWETRLGEATYQWLDASFAAIKFPMNQAHHFSSRDFGQLEAQMLLAVTTSLIAYAVNTNPDPQ